MFKKFQILKKALKRAKSLKNLEKQRKKLQFFLCMRFYTGRKNVNNKKKIYAKFFEFEARHLFWGVASSLSILCKASKKRKSKLP
jgi:hypothetical protein